MAHELCGLVYGVHLGTAGPKKDMAVLMNLNHNGQAITQSKALADKGAVGGPSLAKFMAANQRDYTFAATFPTGTHAMGMHCWPTAAGINPLSGATLITVPPLQMVTNMGLITGPIRPASGVLLCDNREIAAPGPAHWRWSPRCC